VTTFNDYPELDRRAFQLAIDATLNDKDPGRRVQIKAMLEEDALIDVAHFASYHQQVENMNLKPWETPPCWADPDETPEQPDERSAVLLARRMRALGISAYHPDPLAAIKEAEAKAAAK